MTMNPILAALQQWAPFRIDALGLVTILGAEETCRVLGQLTRSSLTDALPLLGAYMLANNNFTEPLRGFALYNITDGIQATDLSGWFCCWLLSQEFTDCSSLVEISDAAASSTSLREKGCWDCADAPRRRSWLSWCAHALGWCLTLVPVVAGFLICDWWGVANGLSMLASVVVRQGMVAENARAIDLAVEEAVKTSTEEVKLFLTLPIGKVLTVRTTRGIAIECLLTSPRPPSPRLYLAMRALGWLAFGVHIVALGMATLFCQLLTVVLLICATVATVCQVGADREHIGRRLVLSRSDGDLKFRAVTYARLELTPKEEDSMVLWNLFPHRRNQRWWDKYRKAKEADDFETWDVALGKSAE